MSGSSSSSSLVPAPSVRQTSKKVKPFSGHHERIYTICHSPDGKQIATGGSKPPIRIWDSDTGELLLEPEFRAEAVFSMCYSPDGKRLVSADVDGGVGIWDASKELVLTRLRRIAEMSWINAVTFSHDNQRIASAEGHCSARIWRAKDLALLEAIQHPHDVESVDFSPDGTRLATGCSDKSIRIFDVKTGALVVGPLGGYTERITAVTYSPNGEQLAGCSYDGVIGVWDASTGSVLLGPLRGHVYAVTCMVYSPDGKQLVTGSNDETVRIWDSETGQPIGGPVRGHSESIAAISFAPDGSRFVTGAQDGSMRVWDARAREVLSPEFTEDEKDRYRLTGPFRGHLGGILAVAYFPDGQRMASGSHDHTIRIWDVQTGKEVVGPLTGHTRLVRSIALSSDGSRVVSGGDDCKIGVWDTRTGDLVHGLIAEYEVSCVKFSPNDKVIATADTRRLTLWDSETGEQLRVMSTSPCTLSFSPDGSRLATGSLNNFIYVWDVSTFELIAGPFRGHEDMVRSVAFSPDGLSIVSGSEDSTVRIWDAMTGATILEPLEAHSGVMSVAYSPDGTRICSSTVDGTISVWHATTGDLIFGPLQGNQGQMTSAIFSLDGKQIVTGSQNWKINFLDAFTGEIIEFPDNSGDVPLQESNEDEAGSSVLDLPATHAPGQELQTQPIQQIALRSFFDLPETTRPQDLPSKAAVSVHVDSAVQSTFFSFTRLRSALMNVFHNSPSTSDAVELQERRHRWTPRPIRTAYTRMKSFVVIASKSIPREQVLRDVSEEGSTGDGGGSQRRGPGVGENVTSTQPGGVADASGTPPAEAPTGETPQNENQQDPPSIQPSSPYVAPDPADRPRITFAAGSVESEDSFEADCCPCCCLRR